MSGALEGMSPAGAYRFMAPPHRRARPSLCNQADNQPHNFLFTGRHIYIFPKPLQRPERSFELYPETVGGPELVGSFTVYKQDDYDALTTASAQELLRLNTAPLPSRVLHRGADCCAAAVAGVDDSTLGTRSEAAHSPAPRPRTAKLIPSSRSLDMPCNYRRLLSLGAALATAPQPSIIAS